MLRVIFLSLVSVAILATGYYTGAVAEISAQVSKIRTEFIDYLPAEILAIVSLITVGIAITSVYKIIPR